MPMCECKQCGKHFKVIQWLIDNRNRGQFCSHVCSGLWHSGDKNHRWGNGICKKTDGYVLVKSIGHPRANRFNYVREHILVMESFIGRYLVEGEVVHHVDENRSNNNIDNLKLMAYGDHQSMHHTIKLDLSQILLDSQAGMSSRKIAAKHGCSHSTILTRLRLK